ncbi:MAG: XdhC family protein, partial [Gammaproteobacteria bacterium]
MMEYADLQVLSQLTDWVKSGRMAWLCTVVKTWGSSPRPIGSLLCCNDDGEVAGSLSGGCIEEDLLERLQQGRLTTDKPQLLIYGATQEEVERFQLPCGGQLHIVIEPFPDTKHLEALQAITGRLEDRACISRSVDLGAGDF